MIIKAANSTPATAKRVVHAVVVASRGGDGDGSGGGAAVLEDLEAVGTVTATLALSGASKTFLILPGAISCMAHVDFPEI
jgi:hypothetical protein